MFNYKVCQFWNGVLAIVNWTSLALALMCLASIILVACCVVFNGSYRLCLSKDGVDCMLKFWSEYRLLFKAFLASLTLLVAGVNLRKFIDAQSVQCLSEIRTKLNSEEKKRIHAALLTEKGSDEVILNWEDQESVTRGKLVPKSNRSASLQNIELYDYLGTIELASIMVQKGLMTEEQFENQFGYRLKNCFKSDDVRSYVYREDSHYADLKFMRALLNKR